MVALRAYELSAVPFTLIRDYLNATFLPVSQNSGIGFKVSLARDLPPTLVTDEKRILQVFKNLLSNAFKFTEQGGEVVIRMERALLGWSAGNSSLNQALEVFAFTVEDTGIGIPEDRQRIIFEAFQQADGSTARKYGGTGLGLSISREIARLLGGEIKLAQSVPGQGSVFVLYVPQHNLSEGTVERKSASELTRPPVRNGVKATEHSIQDYELKSMELQEMSDDRADIKSGDRILLIIEDDPAFAKIVLELAREKGFRGIIAMRGALALELARQYKPDAITLDISIPDMDGWTVLEVLKRDPDLRHIPVDIITVEEDSLRGLTRGAFQFLTKPVTRKQLGDVLTKTQKLLDRPVKSILLVVGDKDDQKKITDLLGNDDLIIQSVVSGKAGLIAMRKKICDCVIVGSKLVDMTGIEFINALHKDKTLIGVPAVIYSNAPLSDAEQVELDKLAELSVVKTVMSPDRLLDQTALFLHRVVSQLPEDKRKLLLQLQQAETNLGGKKVLIVDDDVRNIFALTAALERKGMLVSSVENGRAAIDILKAAPGIDIVLMDIMMPGMDGYTVIREIRKLVQFKKLPIIALTAKAMKGDREICLEAGASDYLSKPINIEQLSALIQVWLSR
jgi:CheY-like chemotaxis protein